MQTAAARVIDSPAYVLMIAQDFAPDPTFAFADEASAAGDIDAAIGALEQLLVRYPDQRQAHARMARLYEASGNDALAKLHRDLAGLPPRTLAWGRATMGIAHETNPGAAPIRGQVQLFDAGTDTFVRVPGGEAKAEQLATLSLDLNLVHGLSDTTLFAAEVYVDAETYAATEELNNLLLQATVGPWVALPAAGEGASIRPFLTGGAGMLDSSPYYGSLGVGTALSLPISTTLAATFVSELTYTDYSGAISPSFDANTLDNLEVRAGAQLAGSAGDVGFAIYTYGGYAAAAADSESYASLRGGAIMSAPVPGLATLFGRPLFARLGTSIDWFAYQDPNLAIDPTQSRRDLWLGAEGALILGVTDTFDLTVGIDYTRRLSNLDIFDNHSMRVFLEAGVNF